MREHIRQEIIEVIEKFAHTIDPEIEVYDHEEFASDILSKAIFINTDEFFEDTPLMEIHKKLLKELGYKIDISIPVHAILHEIGHIVMAERYHNPALELLFYNMAVDRIAQKEIEVIDKIREYKGLALEVDADEFAYDFYTRYPKKVKALQKEILDLI